MIFLLNKIYLRSYNASFIPILIRVLIEFIKLELFNNIYLIIEFDFSQDYKEIPKIFEKILATYYPWKEFSIFPSIEKLTK